MGGTENGKTIIWGKLTVFPFLTLIILLTPDVWGFPTLTHSLTRAVGVPQLNSLLTLTRVRANTTG